MPMCTKPSFRVVVAGLSLGDVVEVGVGKKEVEDKREGEWNRGKIAERSSNMDDMWMEEKVLCKHACETLSHAVHVNKVKCERESVPREVFCLQKTLERPNNIQNDLYIMYNLANLLKKQSQAT